MTELLVTDLLERIVLAGVAITTRALSEAMPGLDLTFPQWRALLIVGQTAEGATVSEVAARVGVTVPATSRQLRRLARRGLVEIRRDERDQRATRARLTTEGRAARTRILRFRRERLAAAAADVVVSARTLRELERAADALERDAWSL